MDAAKNESSEQRVGEETSAEHAQTTVDDENIEVIDGEEVRQTSPVKAKPIIPDDFFYDIRDYISHPTVAEGLELPENLLQMTLSLGYDCHKRSNLFVLDSNTLAFINGNYVVFFSLDSSQQSYLRSTGGCGISHMAVHPSRLFFATAEKGIKPAINIFDYPAQRLHRILREGTEEAYAYVSFNPNGKFLASVGGFPDYMLTIWDWKQETTVLRSKAFSQDVYRVSFSADLDGYLTTAGSGHIRFWRMSDTFTGLKLQGEIGKFGKTELSDIEGFLDLPDGKVLSGSEWGNLLVWDGGLIKVEIGRKGKKNCHQSQIYQILMDEGEVITVGDDGYIRVWDFETIDTAEPKDDVPTFELEPMNELCVSSKSRLRHICKSVNREELTTWYAQDASGSIWKLDLSFSHTAPAPKPLFTCHAGAVNDCCASPIANVIATIGADGEVRVHDVTDSRCLASSLYVAPGSCILWAPTIIDQQASTIYSAFADGVLRVLNFVRSTFADLQYQRTRQDCRLLLRQVFKPHSKAISSLKLSRDSKTLVTGSMDGSVFFFNVGSEGELEPLGFTETDGPITGLNICPFGSINEDRARFVLAFTANGYASEIRIPKPGEFDVAHSFRLEGLETHPYQFQSVKSRLRFDEMTQRRRKQFEEDKKTHLALLKRRYESGEIEQEEFEEKQKRKEEEKFEEEEFRPVVPDEPSPILCGFYDQTDPYGDGRAIWLSMGDYDAGYLYRSRVLIGEDAERAKRFPETLGRPLSSVDVVSSNDVPICDMLYLNDGRLLVMGLRDGQIRIQLLAEPFKVDDLSKFWTVGMHDCQYGLIRRLCLNCDNSLLFSVGGDGNIFAYRVLSNEAIAEYAMQVPDAKPEVAQRRVVDIDDPNAHSIEEAKRKAEYDKMMALAEQRKADMRAIIAQLRREFQQVAEDNRQLPEHLRLQLAGMEMAKSIRQDLSDDIDRQVQQVLDELAWDAERWERAFRKVFGHFRQEVQTDFVIVRSFRDSVLFVTSFRCAQLGADFYEQKTQIEREETEIALRSRRSERKADSKDSKDEKDLEDLARTAERVDADDKGQKKLQLKGGMSDRIARALKRVEQKKAKRAARKREWDELYRSCPGEEYEDPQDVAAIAWARDNIGDFKLKSADNFQVPDHLRMNAYKARKRLIELRLAVGDRRAVFNQRLMALRDRKRGLVVQLKRLIDQVQAIQKQLPEEDRVSVQPVDDLAPDEQPEDKLLCTDDALAAFKVSLTHKTMWPKVPDAEKEKKATEKKPAGPSLSVNLLGALGQKPVAKTLSKEEQMEEAVAALCTTSMVEQQVRSVAVRRLCFERDQLLAEADGIRQAFDTELFELRAEYFRLAVQLKMADLRELTLFEELMLLKDFEIQEDQLLKNVQARKLELSEVQLKIEEVRVKTEDKQRDIARYQEEEQATLSGFITNLGDMQKFADFLTKVYKKKIKRKKKQKAGDESDSEESSSDDSDIEESDFDEEADGPVLDLDTCPPGCSQATYDHACQLREQRLDIEEVLAEERKNLDVIKKEMDALQKKAKGSSSALQTAEAELEAFQLAKQRRLNELDITVSLRLGQIRHQHNGEMRRDLGRCLVFEAANLQRLSVRIDELKREIVDLRKAMRNTHEQHVELNKQKKLLTQKINELQRHVSAEMCKKFGKVVNMEVLETIVVNQSIETLKFRIQENGLENDKALAEFDGRIEQKYQEIIDLTRQNTKLLEQLNMLGAEKLALEKSLDDVHRRLGGEFKGERQADVLDRQRLVQLVHLQAREIQALKDEIMILSRKDGHILPPIQPPAQPPLVS